MCGTDASSVLSPAQQTGILLGGAGQKLVKGKRGTLNVERGTMNSLMRILAVIRKEIWHILRDVQTLAIVIAMPVVMMFLYGYALTLDIKELPVVIQDPSASVESRRVARAIDGTTIFRVIDYAPCTIDVEALFKARYVKAVFRFSPDFGRDLRNGGSPAPIQVFIDGSDPNVGTIIRNLVGPLVQNEILDIMNIEQPKLVMVDPVVLYNPQQKSALFFVPGLMALILMMISALLTSLTITREKERGTLEQLLVSPLRPWEVIVGKITPYLLLAAIDGAIILLVGRINFDVRINGSLLFLAAASTVYMITALALGLIFSNIARTQQQAMLMVMPVTLLPIIILSGFIFPIASMPVWLQAVAQIIPATYYLQLIRGIMLKGVGLHALWQPMAILTGMCVLLMTVSIRMFKVKL
jgi:ABC-2 type transport system permease protein